MAAKSSTARRANVASIDPIWAAVRHEAEEVAASEPALGGLLAAGRPVLRRQERHDDGEGL